MSGASRLTAVLAAAALLGTVPVAHGQWEEVFGSPAEFLSGPIQAALSFAGDEIATSGSFQRRDSEMDAKMNLLRLQYHKDLPSFDEGLLAGWNLRGAVSFSDYRANYRFPSLTHGENERLAVRMLSIGLKGTRDWGQPGKRGGHLYALTGLSFHVARFREWADLGTTPWAELVYQGQDNAYINTTVWTASVTARLGMGWRQPLGSGQRLQGFVETSFLPIYTRTVDVETDGQRFSKLSSSLHLRTGLEWLSGLTFAGRQVAFAPSFSRRQFFDNIRPLGEASLNEVSFDALLGPSYRHQALEGLGLGVSWMKSGPWSGWRIQFKGLFG